MYIYIFIYTSVFWFGLRRRMGVIYVYIQVLCVLINAVTNALAVAMNAYLLERCIPSYVLPTAFGLSW